MTAFYCRKRAICEKKHSIEEFMISQGKTEWNEMNAGHSPLSDRRLFIYRDLKERRDVMNTQAQLNNAYLIVDNMSQGLEPISGNPYTESSVLNSPEVIRSMFFLKEVLEKISQYGYPGEKISNSKAVPEFPHEIKERFKFTASTTITHLLTDFYSLADNPNVKRVSAKAVLDWLVLGGYLEVKHDDEINIDYKAVTEKGTGFGLKNKKVINGYSGRSYISVIFSKSAQEYLAANMDKVINGEV